MCPEATYTYDLGPCYCMSVFCGMGQKFLHQMLIAGNGVSESSKLMKLLPRVKLIVCIFHTIQAVASILKLEHVHDDLMCACGLHALRLLSNVCSTADGLANVQGLHGQVHEMVRQMCEHLKCWDANLEAAVLKGRSREAASSAREGSSCTRSDAFTSVQEAGGDSGSSKSQNSTQQGDQVGSSSSSSSSSAAAKAVNDIGGKIIPGKVARASRSGRNGSSDQEQAHGNGSTSSSAQEQAYEIGSSNDQAVGPELHSPKVQSRAAQACVQCGKVAKRRRCARCGQALVCSEACQTAYWPMHRKVCLKS